MFNDMSNNTKAFFGFAFYSAVGAVVAGVGASLLGAAVAVPAAAGAAVTGLGLVALVGLSSIFSIYPSRSNKKEMVAGLAATALVTACTYGGLSNKYSSDSEPRTVELSERFANACDGATVSKDATTGKTSLYLPKGCKP